MFGSDNIYDELTLRNYTICTPDQSGNINLAWLDQVLESCSNQMCLPNCTEQIYSYQVKDSTEFSDEEISNDTIVINLLAKNDNEFTYVYQPKIAHSDLMSNFGGLLSFWLGFSFYEIYSHFDYLINKLYGKKIVS